MSQQPQTTDLRASRKTHKRSFQIPHIYVILFVFIALASIATYFVPAGTYERIPGPDGRTTIDATSFQYVESSPVGPVDFMLAIPNGLMSAGQVVFFTFMIGGMFMVLRRTGIIEIGVDKLSRRFANRSLLMIPVLMTTFAVVATLIGTQELSLVYVPVILPLMIALRFDSVTAAAVALCATTAGFTTGVLNPINTGLGQQLAGLPLYSGFALRAATFVIVLCVGIFFVMRYARKVHNDPSLSLMADDDTEAEKRASYQHATDEGALVANARQKLAALAAFGFFALLVYGVLAQGWFMMEMAGLFIVMGIVVGLIAGLNGDEICEGFNQGFRDVLVGAMIAGIARGVAWYSRMARSWTRWSTGWATWSANCPVCSRPSACTSPSSASTSWYRPVAARPGDHADHGAPGRPHRRHSTDRRTRLSTRRRNRQHPLPHIRLLHGDSGLGWRPLAEVGQVLLPAVLHLGVDLALPSGLRPGHPVDRLGTQEADRHLPA